MHVQSIGASAEFGNVQGAVINVVTKRAGNRLEYDASYYRQTAGLTSQPVRLPVADAGQLESGYERARYRDFTTNLGGPVVREATVVFCRIPISPRLRQPAGQRTLPSTDVRAGQDHRQADLEDG